MISREEGEAAQRLIISSALLGSNVDALKKWKPSTVKSLSFKQGALAREVSRMQASLNSFLASTKPVTTGDIDLPSRERVIFSGKP